MPLLTSVKRQESVVSCQWSVVSGQWYFSSPAPLSPLSLPAPPALLIPTPYYKIMDAIDQLLAQIKAEYDEAKPEQSKPNVANTFVPPLPKSVSLIDNLLAEVQADFAVQDEAEELRRRQELEQERIRQEQIKAKKLEVLKTQAKEWLEKLDPFSSEGLWFERFAESYPSKLEAAIEYLQTN